MGNGGRFQVYGVLDAIHKNELSDHLLFAFSRSQLTEPEIQARLQAVLGRNALESGTAIRATIESDLKSRRAEHQRRREEQAKTRELMAQRTALQEQMRALEAQLGGITPSATTVRSDNFGELPSGNAKAGFKWSREYGPQESVCSWMNGILERLAPSGSTEVVPHTRLTRELCAFLDGRGTERAKALSKEQRSEVAGNMIDWITAQWTIGLGGKDSPLMRSDAGARVESADAPEWLRNFTRAWTRRPMGKYEFRRR